MFRGFSIKVLPDTFETYLEDGRADHDEQRHKVRSKIDSLTDIEGNLVASRITADWFPTVEANAFISHSHHDAALAIGFAGFLKCEFNLTSFIDSTAWGWSGDLLRLIDDKYCYKPKTDTYNYQMRNRSTSHVYMMLTVALARMLNNCETFFFLNTEESLSPKRYIKGDATLSPWIYSELAMTSLIQERSREDHRRRIAKAMDARLDEALRVKYAVDIDHLHALTIDELITWRDFQPRLREAEALDVLYGITGV